MIRHLYTAAVLGAVAMLGISASPASAAKGVKKTGEHHVHGTVVSVQHAAKGKHGTLTIRVAHHKHKKGQKAVNGAHAKKGATQTFTIDHHTRVDGAGNGKNGLHALRPGEHVTVAAHHHHADRVTVNHAKVHAKKKLAKR